MKISGAGERERILRAKMPRYSSGKGNKRSASQPPAAQPPAKAHALSARISSMDKALMFGEDDVGMNVTALIENAHNEIAAAGDLVIEGALQLAKLFIMICGFVKFAFAPVPGQNFPGVFERVYVSLSSSSFHSRYSSPKT